MTAPFRREVFGEGEKAGRLIPGCETEASGQCGDHATRNREL